RPAQDLLPGRVQAEEVAVPGRRREQIGRQLEEPLDVLLDGRCGPVPQCVPALSRVPAPSASTQRPEGAIERPSRLARLGPWSGCSTPTPPGRGARACPRRTSR